MSKDYRVWSFSDPEDVLAFRGMTVEEKRAVLAGWASDEHAVENVPSMRQLDSGAIVPLDAVLAALRQLDAAQADAQVTLVSSRQAAGDGRQGFRRERKVIPFDPDDDGPKPGASGARPSPPPARTRAVAKGRLGRTAFEQTHRLRRRRVAAYRELSQGA